nr:hypothetical protein [Phycisphaerae bacterium]
MSATGGSQQIVPMAGAPVLAPQMAGAPAAVGAAEEAAGISARDAWRIIKQRKLLIIVTICIAYLLVGIGTVLIYRFWPAYSNEAYVELVPPPTGFRGVLEESILPKDYIALRLATHAAEIKNLTLLQEVLEQPEIRATKFYQSYGDNFDKCLYKFQDKLIVAPVRDTYLVRVAIAVRDRRYRVELAGGKGWVVEDGPDGEQCYVIEHALGGKNVFYFLTPLERG